MGFFRSLWKVTLPKAHVSLIAFSWNRFFLLHGLLFFITRKPWGLTDPFSTGLADVRYKQQVSHKSRCSDAGEFLEHRKQTRDALVLQTCSCC